MLLAPRRGFRSGRNSGHQFVGAERCQGFRHRNGGTGRTEFRRDLGPRCQDEAAIEEDAALAEGAAIITRNGDFAALHSHAPGGPPVGWLRRADLGSHALEKVLLSALRQIVAGEGVVEVQ